MIKNIISNIVAVIMFSGVALIDVSNLRIELDNTLDNGWFIYIWAGLALFPAFVIRFFWCRVRRKGRRNHRKLDQFLDTPKRDFFPLIM